MYLKELDEWQTLLAGAGDVVHHFGVLAVDNVLDRSFLTLLAQWQVAETHWTVTISRAPMF